MRRAKAQTEMFGKILWLSRQFVCCYTILLAILLMGTNWIWPGVVYCSKHGIYNVICWYCGCNELQEGLHKAVQ